MAITKISTIKATIQMRRGLERDFDADKMTAGEWAVSTDKKYVRMCFAPGIVLRMATYEAFEADMSEIQTILATCRNIQTAVDAMAKAAERSRNDAKDFRDIAEDFAKESESWAVGGTNTRAGEDTDNSEYYSEQSRLHSETSKEYLTKVEQAGNDAVDAINSALDIAVPNFIVDLSTGNLLYDGGRFAFIVNSGNLEWGLIV